MKKILIVLMFIMLGSAIIVISNTNNDLESSYVIEYHNNKNLALPDLTDKIEISNGVYRLFNNYGVTIDYNIYDGFFIMNGTNTQFALGKIFELETTLQQGIYTISRQDYNQSKSINIYIDSPLELILEYITNNNTLELTTTHKDILFSDMPITTFVDYQFRLQIEKGSTKTFYTVPRLVPIYKDNLTYKEKQEIGMGAFNGITQILRTIGNVIEPIGDFFNGLFSLFN